MLMGSSALQATTTTAFPERWYVDTVIRKTKKTLPLQGYKMFNLSNLFQRGWPNMEHPSHLCWRGAVSDLISVKKVQSFIWSLFSTSIIDFKAAGRGW